MPILQIILFWECAPFLFFQRSFQVIYWWQRWFEIFHQLLRLIFSHAKRLGHASHSIFNLRIILWAAQQQTNSRIILGRLYQIVDSRDVIVEFADELWFEVNDLQFNGHNQVICASGTCTNWPSAVMVNFASLACKFGISCNCASGTCTNGKSGCLVLK